MLPWAQQSLFLPSSQASPIRHKSWMKLMGIKNKWDGKFLGCATCKSNLAVLSLCVQIKYFDKT